MESALLQAVLETAIDVLIPVLIAGIIALVKLGVDYMRSKVGEEKFSMIYMLANNVVAAAEQNGMGEALNDLGVSKKEWAINMLDKELQARGIKLDVESLSHHIEAAVYNSFNKKEK